MFDEQNQKSNEISGSGEDVSVVLKGEGKLG
jgi:hypothetical protein